MRATASVPAIQAGLAVILALDATAVLAAVPQPPIDGVVVEDVTQTFSFDRVGLDYETGPYTSEDVYQGTVRSMVIRAADSTFDFYFHITGSTNPLRTFTYLWQAPASYTVAHHVTEPEVLWETVVASGPRPGDSAVGALGLRASWNLGDGIDSGGTLQEGVLVLDTDAKAYAATATYRLADSLGGMQGNYHGQSPEFMTFGPAIPEPETYALMLCGLGLLALGRRWRRAR